MDTAYWAGFFDGEGSIWISLSRRRGCSRPQASLKVGVSNTFRPIMEELVRDFPPPSGRVLNSFLGGPKDQVRRKQQYKWEMSGYSAYNFLRSVRPWLKVKQAQADAAIAFYEKPWRSRRTAPGGGWKLRTTVEVALDTWYSHLLKGMKHAISE